MKTLSVCGFGLSDHSTNDCTYRLDRRRFFDSSEVQTALPVAPQLLSPWAETTSEDTFKERPNKHVAAGKTVRRCRIIKPASYGVHQATQ
jgi:hypothetical protein